MTIEQLLVELTAAIRENTAAMRAQPAPRNVSTETVAETQSPAPTPPAKPEAKPAKVKADAKEITKVDVQQAVVALVNACGRGAAAELLTPFGSGNVTGLDPSHYAAVHAEAVKRVAQTKEAAKAAE